MKTTYQLRSPITPLGGNTYSAVRYDQERQEMERKILRHKIEQLLQYDLEPHVSFRGRWDLPKDNFPDQIYRT